MFELFPEVQWWQSPQGPSREFRARGKVSMLSPQGSPSGPRFQGTHFRPAENGDCNSASHDDLTPSGLRTLAASVSLAKVMPVLLLSLCSQVAGQPAWGLSVSESTTKVYG